MSRPGRRLRAGALGFGRPASLESGIDRLTSGRWGNGSQVGSTGPGGFALPGRPGRVQALLQPADPRARGPAPAGRPGPVSARPRCRRAVPRRPRGAGPRARAAAPPAEPADPGGRPRATADDSRTRPGPGRDTRAAGPGGRRRPADGDPQPFAGPATGPAADVGLSRPGPALRTLPDRR